MNVTLLADQGNADGSIGGAELTMAEFAAAAPEGVTLTGVEDAETVVIGNCVTFAPSLINDLQGKRVIRYHNDLARHEHPELRVWLEEHAEHVFTSPLHQRLYGLDGEWPNIPPALKLDRFRRVASQEDRTGAVAVGAWQNPGKGQPLLREWADKNEPIDIYGTGPFLPNSPNLHLKGPVAYEDVPQVLGSYRTFVHLPTSPEPFGRGVVEAWAASMDLVINNLVGARYWLENEPEKLETAAEDFWDLVCGWVRA